MEDFQLHAMITGKGERRLKYFGSPVKRDGQPRQISNPEVVSRINTWYDGLRVRHWVDKNSVKFYNEHNVLRFEMTMNDPSKFKIYRHAESQKKTEPKKFMPIRKGIADTVVRAEVSKKILDRFAEHMAAVEEKTRLGELVAPISSPMRRNGKKIRALDVFGKDLEFLRAVSDPGLSISGMTNKGLQKMLAGTLWQKTCQVSNWREE
jgi:hypothetical protein